MTEAKGHFENGLWVEEKAAPAAAPPAKEENSLDGRLAAATKSVISAVDDLAKVSRDLVATEEGRKHIEKSVKETTENVRKSFDDILAKAKAEVEKAKAEMEKEQAEKSKGSGQKK
ncbi:MAG: hypothetical protein PHD55_10020 [Methanoregula sp.]|nr:hypothetical protein [Methanoregula sp.]